MDTQRKVKFRDIVEINPRESIPKSTPAKYVAMENLLPFTKKISKYEIKKYKGGAKFRNGDTLLARITPCLENGKTAFVDILKENEIGFGSTEYIVIRKKTKITDSHYVYYLSTSPRFRDSAIKLMSGTSGRQRIEIEGLKNLNISLPPLSEQKRIANILSSFDNKIEILKKENKILEDIAENIFKEWFVKYNFPNKDGKPYRDNNGKMIDSELGSIPEGWRIGKLGDFGQVICGKTPSTKNSSFFGGNYPFIKIPDMTELYVFKTESTLTDLGSKELNGKMVPANSICVSCIATIGKVSITTEDSFTNQQINTIIPNKNIYREYLYFTLSNMQEYLELIGNRGSTTFNINTEMFRNLEIIIPNEELLESFSSATASLFEKILVNSKLTMNLEIQKDKLLKELVK